MNSMKIASDVICFARENGRWILYNVRARTAVGVDIHGLDAIDLLRSEGGHPVTENLPNNVLLWEIGHFSNIAGLLADPSRFYQSTEDWPDPKVLSIGKFQDELIKECILIKDADEYEERFNPKSSLVDRFHIGNFHQQLGQHLMLGRRADPSKWWLEQKFSIPGVSLANNLYSSVQGRFLEGYLKKIICPGIRVLDVGCGPGYFSNMMARLGAEVIGVDPSGEYLDIARQNSSGRATYLNRQVGSPGAFDGICENSFDLVFMSDALLFYFVPESPNQSANAKVLLSDIHRVLKSDGLFVSVEPHYLFWLAPWLGDVTQPFTLFAEYNDRPGMRVTPTISTLISTFCESGFCISGMREMYPEAGFEEVDERAYHFAKRFPLWQLYELKKAI